MCGSFIWALSSTERWVQAQLKACNNINIMIFCPCNKLAARQTTALSRLTAVLQTLWRWGPLSTVLRRFNPNPIHYGIVCRLRAGILAHAHPIVSSRQMCAGQHLRGASFHNLAWRDNQTRHGMPDNSIRGSQPAHVVACTALRYRGSSSGIPALLSLMNVTLQPCILWMHLC